MKRGKVKRGKREGDKEGEMGDIYGRGGGDREGGGRDRGREKNSDNANLKQSL